MAKNKNCPNCGAVINPDKDKCEYCGTSYYDLSCIPFNEPFYLRLNIGTREHPRIILQKVYTTNVTVDYKSQNIDICGYERGVTTSISRLKSPFMEQTYELRFNAVEPPKYKE